jgi:hypothetical protein
MALRQWLGNLVDRAGTSRGWNDLGISERIAGGPTTNTGITPQSQQAGFLPYTPLYNPNQILGATTQQNFTPAPNFSGPGGFRNLSGGGGSGMVPTGQPSGQQTQQNQSSGPSLEDLLRGQFDYYTGEAERMRGSARRGFDDLLANIGSFRDRSKSLYDQAGQQITNRSADALYSNARTGQEAEGRTRSMGRALGLSDSSKMNRADKALAQTAAAQGDVMARRGENEMANQSLLDEREDTASAQERQGQSNFDNLVEQADAMRRGGMMQSLQDYQGRIQAMQERQQALQQMGLLNTAGLQGPQVNFEGMGDLSGQLNQMFANQGQGTQSGGVQGGNMAQGSYQDLIRRLMGG